MSAIWSTILRLISWNALVKTAIASFHMEDRYFLAFGGYRHQNTNWCLPRSAPHVSRSSGKDHIYFADDLPIVSAAVVAAASKVVELHLPDRKKDLVQLVVVVLTGMNDHVIHIAIRAPPLPVTSE